MKILVTGGCGFKGSVLVPKLLDKGFEVVVVDIQWFGNELSPHKNLSVIKGDVRYPDPTWFQGVTKVIHLASVANDPCGDLNPKLTWEISALGTMQIAEASKRAGVDQFIYASSGSVYGVKTEEQVTEDLSLEPISEYNKTKMVAERVLLSYQDDFRVQIIRPATVCGFSPRMRLDLSVNILTYQALSNKNITVFGGTQTRPNIHIEDITDLYIFCIENPNKLSGVYNAGFENLSIQEIANLVCTEIPAEITVTPSNDPRSYRINSDKLLATGFQPQRCVKDAILELREAIDAGNLRENSRWFNLKWMQQLDNVE